VTQSENLRLQGSAGPKNGGDQSTKGDEKRVHRGDHYDLTRNRKPRVFSSDGIFGSHTFCPSIAFSPSWRNCYGLAGTGALASDFSRSLVMREKMSTGTGKTTVVFFSTPISVRVCR
jgi:hypothetical protein